MTLRLAWANLTNGDANGYAVAGRELRRATLAAARQSGAHVVSEFAPDWEALVMVGSPVPWVFAPDEMRRDVVWHTMLEVEPLVPGWAEILNRCGRVWAPSTWVADLFHRHGVTVPVEVAGYGIDPAVFRPEERPGNPLMRFGVWADALHTRKHVEMGVNTWLAAKPRLATLEVKLTDMTAAPFWVDEQGREHTGVRVLRGEWSQHKLADWLRSLDCLIYLSGGEGFGLMPLEAMACGTPVICAYNTGMKDYLSDHNAILVERHTPEPAETYTARFGPDYRPWQLRPDFDEAVAAIRWASDERDGRLLEVGRWAAADAGRLTWEAAGRKAWEMLARTTYQVSRVTWPVPDRLWTPGGGLWEGVLA